MDCAALNYLNIASTLSS